MNSTRQGTTARTNRGRGYARHLSEGEVSEFWRDEANCPHCRGVHIENLGKLNEHIDTCKVRRRNWV